MALPQKAPAGPVMKLRSQMADTEFDHYFQRAALEYVAQERRGSLPIPSITYDAAPESHHRRVASCKVSRKKGTNGANTSPKPDPLKRLRERRGSGTDVNRPNKLSVDANMLKAPLPPTDSQSTSAPHSRSSSWRKSRRPRQKREVTREARARACSVPTEEILYKKLQQLRILSTEDRYVVRNFKTSPKGIVSKGDLIKNRSSTSLASEEGSLGDEDFDIPQCTAIYSPGSGAPSATSSPCPSVFRVLFIGDHGVGKSAIVQQFMTSEYMGAIDASFDEWGEKTVSVLLDGEETIMDIIEIQSDKNYHKYGDVDAYVLVYSVTDRSSFNHVVEVLQELRGDDSHHSALILVANKRDLVRSRIVDESEGRDVALANQCKCTEVSAVLHHKIDDLLVGIARQIRLQPKREEQTLRRVGSSKCIQRGKFLIEKILPKKLLSKSCDNLLVL